MRLLRFAGRCVRLVWSFLAAVVPSLLVDAIGIVGATAIVIGARQVYEPAGFIVAGTFMLNFAFLMARRSK